MLRKKALEAIVIERLEEKIRATEAIALDDVVDSSVTLLPTQAIPGREQRPELVAPDRLSKRSVNTTEGRAALIHALAHIELNAIDLALDIVWRFPSMPDIFYRNWIGIAQEEAHHFTLLRTHLEGMGYAYGDFPAHNGLWEMAEKTKGDLLARLALVPRTLEARGLDASPLIRHKLQSVGDKKGSALLDLILRDEIGHVATGNRWYKWLCEVRGLEPVACYSELSRHYQAPKLRGPFNLEARRAAGFDEAELAALTLTAGS